MLKHGQKIAPVGVDKNHKCGLYVNMPWTRSCTYCCFYCKQRKDCVNACKIRLRSAQVKYTINERSTTWHNMQKIHLFLQRCLG